MHRSAIVSEYEYADPPASVASLWARPSFCSSGSTCAGRQWPEVSDLRHTFTRYLNCVTHLRGIWFVSHIYEVSDLCHTFTRYLIFVTHLRGIWFVSHIYEVSDLCHTFARHLICVTHLRGIWFVSYISGSTCAGISPLLLCRVFRCNFQNCRPALA